MQSKLSSFRNVGTDALVFLSVLFLASLAACSRDQPPQTAVVQQPAAPAQVAQPQPQVLVQDDYVYYPQYEVYYSNSRHQYGYREGNAWSWRAEPPHIALNVLIGSPSVHMNFHDSPALHHDVIVRSYPRNWSPPPARLREERMDHKDERDDRKERH